MIDNPWFWALAIPAVIMLGLAKGGFAGFGAVAMPMVALAISPVRAAGILLPILIVQDIVGVWAFRRTWDKYILAVMIPGAIVGIVFGYLLAAQVNAPVLLAVLGTISIVFALYRLWLAYGGHTPVVRPHNRPADYCARRDGGRVFRFHLAGGPCRPAAVSDSGCCQRICRAKPRRHDGDLFCGGELDQGAGLYRP